MPLRMSHNAIIVNIYARMVDDADIYLPLR